MRILSLFSYQTPSVCSLLKMAAGTDCNLRPVHQLIAVATTQPLLKSRRIRRLWGPPKLEMTNFASALTCIVILKKENAREGACPQFVCRCIRTLVTWGAGHRAPADRREARSTSARRCRLITDYRIRPGEVSIAAAVSRGRSCRCRVVRKRSRYDKLISGQSRGRKTCVQESSGD